MSESHYSGTIRWWAMVVAGAAAALLFAWLGRVAGVPLATLLYVGAGLAPFAWMIVLVTVPWNLYFAARQVLAEIAVSRERRIKVRAAQDPEVRPVAPRMLVFSPR